jgi:hypothetical protein
VKVESALNVMVPLTPNRDVLTVVGHGGVPSANAGLSHALPMVHVPVMSPPQGVSSPQAPPLLEEHPSAAAATLPSTHRSIDAVISARVPPGLSRPGSATNA